MVASPETRFHRGYQIIPEGCWQWIKAQKGGGYGAFSVDGVSWRAHRWSYVRFVGSIPDEMEIDHRCRNRLCVNPAHLEAVTRLENTRRARLFRPLPTHCKWGHEFTEANTAISIRADGKIKRACRVCRRSSHQAQYAADPQGANARRTQRKRARRARERVT